MASFPVPYVAPSSNWGPPDELVIDDDANPNAPPVLGNLVKYAALPYSPFGRNDRLGRAADFSSSNRGMYNKDHQHHHHRRGDRYNNNQDNLENKNEDNEETFQLVDTTKTATTKRFVNPASKRRQHTIRLRQINARRQQSAGGAAAPVLDKMMGSGGRGGMSGRGGRGHPGRGGRGHARNYNARVDRQPSVAVQPEWVLCEEIDLSKLNKNLTTSTEVPTVEDILWCGFLDQYNDTYDKVSARQPVTLKRIDNKEFYPVTTTDDPVLEKLAIDGVGQIFITDAILSHLMTCTRSVYPWDIVVQKLPGNILFFDKRDDSQFDYLTVQETAYSQPPNDDDINNPNSPLRLSLEATMVNQNFSQQILKKTGRKDMDLPNPFYDDEDANDGMEPSSVAFRYRKFQLEKDVTLICRTELHGLVKKTQYMTSFALNEYIPNTGNNNVPINPNIINWRDKIDTQRGAVLATELKNNSFKLAKFTAQSILSGSDQMKIGFTSRVNPKSIQDGHVILATQFYRPIDFAQQITLQESQMWCLFRYFVTLLNKQNDECGKYVIMRNPNKPIMYLYKVPFNTFDNNNEDE